MEKKPTENPERCETCECFELLTDQTVEGKQFMIGNCRRFPPQQSVAEWDNDGETTPMDWYDFPKVKGSDWCWEYVGLDGEFRDFH